jgi:GntR family transcriptional regulator, transcriptional repressor for pyruvate dehydrogenase complex
MIHTIMSNPSNAPAGDAAWDRRSEKVSAIIAREIVRDIARQQLAPGTTLESESAMLRRYQVARASLREALRILETHGLIRIKPGPGGGPVVSNVTTAAFGRMATLFFQMQGIQFRELVEARLILEPVMARLAAERQNPADNEELKAIAQAGFDADDDATWGQASRAFHDKVLSMSGNRLLNLVAGALHDIFADRVSGLLYGGRQRDQVKKVHAEIAEAISAGDDDRAESLMREHMNDYKKAVAKREPRLLDEVVDWR